MKKFLIYVAAIVVAMVLGGVIGNLCTNVTPLSWLDYVPPFHMDEKHWNLYVLDMTFGFQSKFNIAQLILTIVAIFVAPKIESITKK